VRLVVTRLGELGGWLAGASLFLMMVLGAVDIVGTKFFDRPLPGTFEATEALMVLTVFLALAHVQARRQHIAVDLIVSRLGPGPRRALDLVARLLTVGVFAVIAWQGWVFGSSSFQVREYASGIVQFPVYPSKLALALGATLMLFRALLDLIDAVRGHAQPA
jgi:TRAP-type C4-dicarboxylate transport system permease small subunit